MQRQNDQIKEIYQKYVGDVFRFLRSFTGSKEEAEDLTQEVFIRVLKALSDDSDQFLHKTWIFSIAKNVAIDHYRRKKLAQFHPKEWMNLFSREGNPENELELKESSNEVQQVLMQLKLAHRMVVILRCLKDMSVKETAEILGCSESKVKVDYHRGLKELEQILLERGNSHVFFSKEING